MKITPPSEKGLKLLAKEIRSRHREEKHLPDCGSPECMVLAAFLQLNRQYLAKLKLLDKN